MCGWREVGMGRESIGVFGSGAALAMAAGTAVLACGADPPPPPGEPVSAARAAIIMGQPDVDKPPFNSVIHLTTPSGKCSGTIITSTLALTAVHCNPTVGSSIWVGLPNPGAGATNPRAKRVVTAVWKNVASVSKGFAERARDVAIVRFSPPLTMEASPQKPTFQSPPLEPDNDNCPNDYNPDQLNTDDPLDPRDRSSAFEPGDPCDVCPAQMDNGDNCNADTEVLTWGARPFLRESDVIGTPTNPAPASIVALEVGVNPFVYTWDYSTAKPELIPRPPDVQEDYGVIVKGSEVVFLRDSGLATARAFAVRHADGTVENLFQKPSVWSAFLRSDGTSFCWQELSQSDAGSVLEVWKSPFTTVPAGFKAEKLASIPGAEVFVQAGLAGGYWVYRMNEQTLRAIRVSDGKHLDVQAPPGFGWIVPFGVVNGEIWAQIHVVPGTDGNPYSVARVPLASLGEPVP